ncbi:hypothetical protein BDP27DRAFT_1413538 [Rhodocollybia butyracea]|uniref:Uncharacterized protein n=1 Tax=Rhodocollybia butyracea TaxID=206335 RepID=A0A9P5UGT9_9AGAR|nr:hypothetical protein BDP27DRAFT_1413538 [Rhodocollybia butyracea]
MTSQQFAIEGDIETTGITILSDAIDAAVLGLGDRDDDFRAVASSGLLPVTGHLVDQLPEALDRILLVLWSCLGDTEDALSSSVGAVMKLLGKIVVYDKLIEILANETVFLPLNTLRPYFPFSNILLPTSVRLSIVKTLHSFLAVESLPRTDLCVLPSPLISNSHY